MPSFEYSIRQITRLFYKPTNHELLLQEDKTFVRKTHLCTIKTKDYSVKSMHNKTKHSIQCTNHLNLGNMLYGKIPT